MGIMSFLGIGSNKEEVKAVDAVQPKPMEGWESIDSTLPTKTISFFFCPKPNLISRYSQIFANELKVPATTVKKDLNRLLKYLRNDLTCCIEYPYVDEYYRDSYYSYYSRKHVDYNRYCFRVSFFSKKITENNYFTYKDKDSYFGYMVLRPTPRRIIGYTFLSPKAYVDNNFSICQCDHLTSVMGRRQIISAFPFCGQDGEMILCAETSVIMMFDYFSRRYNKYSRVLPSKIASNLEDNLADRLQPSRGIDINAVNTIFYGFGMNTRRIVKATKDEKADGYAVFKSDRFRRLLNIYVESGFPLYAIAKEHAFIIVGRENKLFYYKPAMIAIDDRSYPYKQLDDNAINEILAFLVPLPENVLMDADKINVRSIYDKLYEDSKVGPVMEKDVKYYNHIFLTTSRAYKQYVVSSNVSKTSKKTIVELAMPRFIWVCETIKESDLQEDISKIPVYSTLLLDATDFPLERDKNQLLENNHLLMVKTQQMIIRPEDDNLGKTEINYIKIEANEMMHPFNNNLKGAHNGWQG